LHHTERRCITKRYLLFDSGCSLCTEVARRVEEAAGGWLEARSLRDPEMRALLDRARPGWKWEPTLVEVAGDEVRVYQGLGMRVRMVRGLGIKKTLLIIKVVNKPMNTQGFDASRRWFLSRTSGFLMLLLFGRAEFGQITYVHPNSYEQGISKIELLSGQEISHLLDRARAHSGFIELKRHLQERGFMPSQPIGAHIMLENGLQIKGVVTPYSRGRQNILLVW